MKVRGSIICIIIIINLLLLLKDKLMMP